MQQETESPFFDSWSIGPLRQPINLDSGTVIIPHNFRSKRVRRIDTGSPPPGIVVYSRGLDLVWTNNLFKYLKHINRIDQLVEFIYSNRPDLVQTNNLVLPVLNFKNIFKAIEATHYYDINDIMFCQNKVPPIPNQFLLADKLVFQPLINIFQTSGSTSTVNGGVQVPKSYWCGSSSPPNEENLELVHDRRWSNVNIYWSTLSEFYRLISQLFASNSDIPYNNTLTAFSHAYQLSQLSEDFNFLLNQLSVVPEKNLNVQQIEKYEKLSAFVNTRPNRQSILLSKNYNHIVDLYTYL